MGAADGVSAAPAPTTGQQHKWRRTPITSQSGNGTLTNPDSTDKEFQSNSNHVQQYQVAPESRWETALAILLKDDWNRLVETPIAGFEHYGFKELVRIGPKLLDMCNLMDFVRDSKQAHFTRRQVCSSIKYCFLNGPVFRECEIDPTMFPKLSVSKSEDCYSFEQLSSVEGDDMCEKFYAGIEIMKQTPVKKENRIAVNPTHKVPAKQTYKQPPPVKVGYQPANLETEFPDLGGSSTSPKDQATKGKFVASKYPPKPKFVQNFSFESRKRTNMVGKLYLNDQLDKLFEEKEVENIAKNETFTPKNVPSTSQNQQPSFNHYQRPHNAFQHRHHNQPVVFLRRDPSQNPVVPNFMMHRGASTVINKEGITNNFQASHGYRQWKRTDNDSSAGTSN